MGQDKAQLRLGELSLLNRVATTLRPLFSEVTVSVRQLRPELALEQVCDPAGACGPLAGLAAGLERAETPWLFAVACDMPFISPAVIACLAAHRSQTQAVVPLVGGHPQPLAAFYAVSCLAAVRAVLSGRGQHSLRALLENLQVRYVEEAELTVADPALRSFFDLDTPQDVAVAVSRGWQ